MKTRIVERKDDNGDLYYVIQCRFCWLWWNYRIDAIYGYDSVYEVKSRAFGFSNIKEAQATLWRISQDYSYKGVKIYPTISPYEFYSYYGSQRSLQYGYNYLIHGTYEECCEQIERCMNTKKNRKYKRIIK